MESDNIEKLIAERYLTLPSEVKELIDFGIVSKTLARITLDHTLNPEQKISLENRVYLILLFLFPSTALSEQVAEVTGVDGFRASIIANYLKTELFDLIEEILEVTDEKFLLKVEANASTVTTATETPTATTPIDNITPFRTMEMDAKKIHGYGAFRGVEPREDQPVYRSEQAKLVPPPSYTDDSSPPNRT